MVSGVVRGVRVWWSGGAVWRTLRRGAHGAARAAPGPAASAEERGGGVGVWRGVAWRGVAGRRGAAAGRGDGAAGGGPPVR